MKKAANIIQIILTILMLIFVFWAIRVMAHNHHPTQVEQMFAFIGTIVFWLWFLFSIVHLFVRIVRKFTKPDSK